MWRLQHAAALLGGAAPRPSLLYNLSGCLIMPGSGARGDPPRKSHKVVDAELIHAKIQHFLQLQDGRDNFELILISLRSVQHTFSKIQYFL